MLAVWEMLRHQTIKNSQQRQEAEHTAALLLSNPSELGYKGQLLPPRVGWRQSAEQINWGQGEGILQNSKLTATLILLLLT